METADKYVKWDQNGVIVVDRVGAGALSFWCLYVNFEQIWQIVLVFLLLNWNKLSQSAPSWML